MKKLIARILVLAIAVSGLAGCNTPATPATSETPATPPSAAEPATPPTETPEPSEAPVAADDEIPAGEWVVGLSNSYYGNTWRKQMVDSFTKVAEEAKSAGYIKDFLIQNGDGSVNAQIAQINSFILEGVDVICINAASATALNSVIDKAVASGIQVIAFDSTVDNDNAYCMDFDFAGSYYKMGDYMANTKEYKGNVVMVRGVSGSVPDDLMYSGYQRVVDEHPDLKVIATVQGEADATVAQDEFTKILPSLDKVDMIFNQGGDTYGIIQAFEQAGLEIPPMSGDNSAEFIRWWLQQEAYDTISMRGAPACGSAAFWTALNVLNGQEVPKKIDLALSIITRAEADQFADLEAGSIAGMDWTNAQVMEEIIIPSRTK